MHAAAVADVEATFKRLAETLDKRKRVLLRQMSGGYRGEESIIQAEQAALQAMSERIEMAICGEMVLDLGLEEARVDALCDDTDVQLCVDLTSEPLEECIEGFGQVRVYANDGGSRLVVTEEDMGVPTEEYEHHLSCGESSSPYTPESQAVHPAESPYNEAAEAIRQLRAGYGQIDDISKHLRDAHRCGF